MIQLTPAEVYCLARNHRRFAMRLLFETSIVLVARGVLHAQLMHDASELVYKAQQLHPAVLS